MMMNWLESYPLISVTVQNVCFTKWKELGGKKKKQETVQMHVIKPNRLIHG